MCVCGINVSGGQVFSGGNPGERGAVAGMPATAAQLETGVQLHEAWRHSAADGARIHGGRLDVIHWQVSTGAVLLSFYYYYHQATSQYTGPSL